MGDDDPRPEIADEGAADEAMPAVDAPADEATAESAPAPDVPTEEPPPPEGQAGEAPADVEEAKPARKRRPKVKPPPPDRLEGALEAILLTAGDVVRIERLRDLMGLTSVIPVREALASIGERWSETKLAVELEEVAGGVRVVTRPEYAEYVARLGRRPAADKLSRTLLETLCLVAYKQPVGRAEVERVRGVQSGDALRALLERRLLKVVGRSDLPGRPLLYGTTQRFLAAFGLRDLKDLPTGGDLKRL